MSSKSSTPNSLFSTFQAIRIVNVDSYMSYPVKNLDVMYSEFRSSSVGQVPVVRVFGSIPTGEKICVHIHGVFPYIYIPFDGSQDANTLMYKIAACIDKAVNISHNQATSNMQHVYKISLVAGIPMYGYHTKEHQFFKINLYNPVLVRKVTSLLLNETTLGSLYQPHEAHINFTLQFMMDYNLHGMSNMLVSKLKYRRDPINLNEYNYDPEVFLPGDVTKMSVCQLEGDCLAEDILNRMEIATGNIAANPGIAALWDDERQRRRNKGFDSQVEHLLELSRTDLPPTKSHLIYQKALSDRLAVFSNERNTVNKLNSSVYPAETPENTNIKNASMTDSQIPLSLDNSSTASSFALEETVGPEEVTSINISLDQDAQQLLKVLNELVHPDKDTQTSSSSEKPFIESSIGLDETIRPAETSALNISLDQDAQQLLIVLNDLEENMYEMEEDSILTQISKENNEDADENELDFSMSLEAIANPTTVVPEERLSEGSDDDLWDTTLIPQVDGGCDETITDINVDIVSRKTRAVQRNSKRITKTLYIKIVKVGRDMPNLEKDFFLPAEDGKKAMSSNEIKTKKVGKKTVYKVPTKIQKRKQKRKGKKEKVTKNNVFEMKMLQNGINKLKKQHQLGIILKRMHEKELQLNLLLYKSGRPKFRVIPKNEIQALLPIKVADTSKSSRVNILSDVIVRIANPVDPSLHLIVKYPNKSAYLFNYNGRFIPEVKKVPWKISQSIDKNDMLDFVKKNVLVRNACGEESIKSNAVLCENIENSVYPWEDGKVIPIPKLNSPQHLADLWQITILPTLSKILEQTQIKSMDKKIDNTNINEVMEEVNKNFYIFSEKYLRDIKDPNMLENIRLKSDEELIKMADDLKNQLQMHVHILKSSNILECGVFSNRECPKSFDNKKIPAESCFFSTKTLVKNRTSNIKKKSTLKRTYTGTLRSSKRTHLSLDGTIDSDTSSEEEQKISKPLRRCRTPQMGSNYKSLPISIRKSPKLLKSSKQAIDDVLFNIETSQKSSSPISRTNENPVCDTPTVKRQLFEKDSPPILQSTIIEEKLVCHIKSVKTPERITTISDKSDETFRDETSTDSTSNSSNMFSTNSETHEKSFFVSQIKSIPALTTAEKYDEENNFEAKEGCSKYLTPTSQDILQSSEGSDLLTPFQRPKIQSMDVTAFDENRSKEVENVRDRENYSPDLTTFQNVDDLGTKFKENEIGDAVGYKDCDKRHVVTLIPKFAAPSRASVLNSLDFYKIPHVNSAPPFYGDVKDVSGSMEVGFNVLKINSTTTVDLLEFESQTNGLNRFRKAKLEQLPSNINLSLKNVMLSHCESKDRLITPVKKPPSVKFVQDWIDKKRETSSMVRTPRYKQEKTKIHVPLSPGDGEMDLSLTLSPSTPKSTQSESFTDSSRASSPIFRDDYKKRKKEVRDRLLSRSVRKSLTLSQDKSMNYSGQITGVTVHASFDKSVQNLQNARAIVEHQNLTVMVMELHIRTRGDFKPDPVCDSIRAVFYSILHDVPEPNPKGNSCKGVIAINEVLLSTDVNKVPILDGTGMDCDIKYVDSENDLLQGLLKLIEYWDPDIFAGYEIQLLSWGYLIERGYALNINLKPLLARVKESTRKQREDESLDELRITGRIVLDVWRLMRCEISLQSYTFESIAYHLLRKRFSHYSFRDLSFWWDHRTQLHRHKTVKYYMIRVVTVLELFDKLDFLGRTSELARLFGIQFFEVLSRGSQFRVESMMLRLAKPLNFIAVSPSVQQRAHMKAPEFIALVMEPESKFYTDPVIVLDFQSLYPSLIIAYNYCFTTCIGRVESSGRNGPFEFGAGQLQVSRKLLKKLLERNLLNFSPCGVGFVKKDIRDGILPRMLREILDARLMVKNSMKENKEDKILQKVFHNRQMGLKLIANVTYGYTSANFSGRMPAVELGDSVVSKGRETLQRAIEMVDSTPEWGARVVYGDTDSLFVLLPGRTKERAFEIGKKIADAITNDNPDPIKLKFEKVYQPCILQTKKRYVGYMYESVDQQEAVYEAKGIETVRRDGCPAVSKMLEKSLRILFETKDVSLVKKYVLKQFTKINAGRISIQDLTFAKEYRGAAGYRPGACVPALELTRKWTSVDKRNEPRSGERVPYVIINGPPGLPLIRLVRSPRDLINDVSLKPNALYYITRVIIPPINRCFNLLGVDINTWYNQMPRKRIQYLPGSVSPKKKSTISQYFSTSSCASCEEQTQTGICQNCKDQPQRTIVTLMDKIKNWERNYRYAVMICQTCTSSVTEVKCISLDCPMYYRRIQTSRDEQQTTYIRQLLSSCDFSF